MLQRIADLPGVDDRDLSSIDWILQGAAPMPPSLVHRWAGLIGAERILMAYGMTEAIGITALARRRVAGARGQRRARASAAPRCGSSTTAGDELPAGEIGEIFMRSPTYGGSDYLGDAPQLRTTDDGFQTVGDMGYLDDDGYLYIVDRRVDMIITGGANVFPAAGRDGADRPPEDRRRRRGRAAATTSGAAGCTPSSSRPTPPTRRRPTR